MNERTGPSLVSTWDTIVANFNFIIPGDQLLLNHTLASNSERNIIYHQSIRMPLGYVDFFGPDSDFIFTRSIPVMGKFLDKYPIFEPITKNIKPGIYEFQTWAKDENGDLSKTVKFKFPINVPGYPLVFVDTPLNGYLTVNKINGEVFKLKIRAFGLILKDLKIQWFDSLKKDSVAKANISIIGGGRDNLSFVKQDTFPNRPGKSFYLKATITNDSGRGANYWIPFERNRLQ